jgi:hypothetical protein
LENDWLQITFLGSERENTMGRLTAVSSLKRNPAADQINARWPMSATPAGAGHDDRSHAGVFSRLQERGHSLKRYGETAL